uniref:Lamin tail domain containing 2 n=1 Tax=Pipistrellus kuhlii TaxID=59472 RepID=A0A7J7QVX7_PIPKU|nr:lamin tail domain containing 2 [Pipistrellus kuhlii]
MAMLQSLSPPGLLGFQASAKEEALPSLADGEPVNGHLEPPADTPAGPVAPAPRRDTKPRPTHVASTKLPLAPESLDPPTLRLVWRQRELEIQALRSLQSQRDAQRSRILREVARLPPERESSRSQEKLLHTQVQKLTLELKKQKEQAQLEKQQLEEQLEQTKTVMHQLEEELEGLHKSCLMQLASTSWVGRILKSSTGSVEVVTAETLLDLSDTSDQDEGSSRHEGFRMEDVDWNAIAHRYPNLLASIHSSSESNWKGSCLKIVAVNLRERFIRVLNQSTEETVDLGGYTLQQLDHDFPVYLYRFPPHTLLEPRHHVTVCPAPPAPARNRRGPRGRGKGPGGAKQPPSSVGGGPRHFHASGSFVTLLLSPKGELLSQFQAPHSVTPAPRTFEDNTTVSIDRFPLPDAEPAADTPEKGRRPRPPRSHPVPRARGRRRPRSPTLLPGLTPSKRSSPGEVPATPERAETDAWEPLPALPPDGPGFADYQAGKEHKEQRIRVSRKTVDRDCPFVALSVQSMREKRFGFRLLSCPPIPVSTSRPV